MSSVWGYRILVVAWTGNNCKIVGLECWHGCPRLVVAALIGEWLGLACVWLPLLEALLTLQWHSGRREWGYAFSGGADLELGKGTRAASVCGSRGPSIPQIQNASLDVVWCVWPSGESFGVISDFKTGPKNLLTRTADMTRRAAHGLVPMSLTRQWCLFGFATVTSH